MKNVSLKKEFISYVSLNVLGMIGISCYILADTFFISNALGALGLAALNFALPLYNVMSGLGMMCGIGGGTKYTVLKSQNQHKSADLIFTHSLLIGLAFGIILFLTGMLFSMPLSRLLGADGEVLGITNTYLKTVFFFAPFFVLNNVLLAFVRNDGNPKLSMTAMLLGSMANIILDYVFIYPLGWGMFGAAFATGLSPIISLFILSFHFWLGKNKLRFDLSDLNFATSLKTVTSLGIPAFVTELSSGIVLLAFNLVIAELAGNVGVAAYGIIANIALVIVAVFTGLAQGVQPLLSRSYGFGETPQLKQLLKYALGCALAVSFVVYAVSFANADSLISVFNSENNGALAELAKEGLIIYFAGFFFAGINIVSTIYFSAVEKPRESFVLALLRGFAVIVPSVFLLSELLGLRGVWLSFPVTEVLTTAVAVFLLIRSLQSASPQVESQESANQQSENQDSEN